MQARRAGAAFDTVRPDVTRGAPAADLCDRLMMASDTEQRAGTPYSGVPKYTAPPETGQAAESTYKDTKDTEGSGWLAAMGRVTRAAERRVRVRGLVRHKPSNDLPRSCLTSPL